MSDGLRLPSFDEGSRLEAEHRHALVKGRVPVHLHDGLVLYLVYGYRPGSFLQAVLENDLTHAVLRGDEESVAGLGALIRFLYDDADSRIWGSPIEVRGWVELCARSRAAADEVPQ